MLFDLQAGASAPSFGNYDVCVCGTGPAGITVARKLAAAGKKVAMLEAGGLEYSEQSQSHYQGTESGLSSFNLALKGRRLRYFGGTSNHWTGLCGLLAESDFLPQRYYDLPGWPIPRSDIVSHLDEAQKILDLERPDFSSKPFGAKPGAFLRPGLANSPPTRFGTKYRKELAESKVVDVFLNANLVDLRLTDEAGALRRIGNVVVSNYRNQKANLVAKQYVLALGAIENARALLNADQQVPSGIGNHADFVGRCFMEHLNVQIGRFVTRKAETLIAKGGLVSPTQQTVRKLNIGNAILSLQTNATPQETGRLAPARGALREAACEFDIIRDFARRFVDFDCAGEGIISSMIEQAPDRNNRVTLTKETDEFGLRRVHLHWTLSDPDRRTVRALGYELAKELLDLDVARVQLSKFITDPRGEIEVWGHAHHMGTTRMAADPRYGVVDVNCRVHGVDNLFVAGSSVFPTGGGINPTLTIVLLTLRLADHLRTTG